MNTATITAKCFGPLREKMGSDQKLTISENEPILAVMRRLSLEPQAWLLYSVNGQQADADTQLHDGDVLMIIPSISGG